MFHCLDTAAALFDLQWAYDLKHLTRIDYENKYFDLSRNQQFKLDYFHRYTDNFLIILPSIFTIATSYSTCAFTKDFIVVKREIELGSCSIISYYIAVLIYHYIMSLIPIMVLVSGFIFWMGKDLIISPLTIYNLALLFFLSVPFYIFTATFFEDNFFAVFFSFVSLFFNSFPINFLINTLKLRGTFKKISFCPVLLNIFPNYSLTALGLDSYLDKKHELALEIAKSLYENPGDFEIHKKNINETIYSIRVTFTSSVLWHFTSIDGVYVLLWCFASFYVFMTLRSLKSRLAPQIRLKLNV